MRLLIRADGGARVGGGHVMRCLALAEAAAARGWAVRVVMADTAPDLAGRVVAAGHDLVRLAPAPAGPDPEGPAHAAWCALPWAQDAAATARAAEGWRADWLIWDHYGLDARWVAAVRQGAPAGMRVMAVDDLDDRALGSDLVLDQTRLAPGPRSHPALATLRGPRFALLRGEFAALRAEALARRGGPVRRVLVVPGLMDAAGLAPRALAALERLPGLAAEVAMGAASQSAAAVAAMVAGRTDRRLVLDAPDMAARMAAADLCIGAGGVTAWERCCLGLPSLIVPVAENQRASAEALAAAGAARVLALEATADPAGFAGAIAAAIGAAPAMAARAAALCDGEGTQRVLDALSGRLRPVTAQDAAQLFAWRDAPRVRAASLDAGPLDPARHAAWVARAAAGEGGMWCVYAEAGRALGHVNAVAGADGWWRWSFYIGAEEAPAGAGGRMLATFLPRLFARPDVRGVTAEVLPHNAASLALHRHLGFRETGRAGAALAFALSRCDIRARFGLGLPAGG
mgnify:CR=1 FL=1